MERKYEDNLNGFITDISTGLRYEGKKKRTDNPDGFWENINKLEKKLSATLDIIRDLKKMQKK